MDNKSTKHYDLFVSYAAPDAAWVNGFLFDALKLANIRFISEEAFRLGAPRLNEFERAVKESRRTLLVLSPAYLANLVNEFTNLLAQTYTLESGTWDVIPLILHPTKLPPRLTMLTSLDATDPAQHETALGRLLKALQCPPGPTPPPPPCPYPGMRSFTEADSARFFGREQEKQALLRQLRSHPFLTVIGPSGSGKSSLVLAGLIPALRQSTLFGPGEWVIKSIRPGAAPLAALESALGGNTNEPARAVAALLVGNPKARHVLVVVDQFEEVFTSGGKQDMEKFQKTLLELSRVPDCYVVLTVRADFFPDLMTSPLWSEIKVHRAEILPLDDAGLRDAIVRPAEAEDVGVFIETALVERLIADTEGEPGVLPFVQETLVLLWDKLERRYLSLHAYDTLILPRSAYGPTPDRARTGLQVAMAEGADKAYYALTPPQQIIARRILLRLIQFGEGRADTRRQQPVSALRAAGEDASEFDKTLKHLTDYRLLTLSGEEEETDKKADIAHEALINGWPMLTACVKDRREAERTRRRLSEKASEWVRLGRGDNGLLDDGIELLEAENWLKSNDAAELGYDATLTQLTEKSSERRRLRQEAKARAERRLRRLALFAVGFAVVAIIAAVLAGLGFRNAERKQLEASSTALAAQAEQLAAGGNGDRAVALAMEANCIPDPPTRAQDALRDVAYNTPGTRNLFSDHSGAVQAVVYSPDGRYILSGGAGKTLVLWNAQTGERVREFKGHPAQVNALAYSRDGNTIVSGDEAGTLIVWDAATGLVQRQLVGHPLAVRAVAISSNGKTFLSASDDRTMILWDQAGKMLHQFTQQGAMRGVAYSPDGRMLASSSMDKQVCLWDSSTYAQIRCFPGAGIAWGARGIAFSPDGKQLIAGSGGYNEGSLALWDVNTGGLLHWLIGHTGETGGVAFSPDGRFAVSGSADSTVIVWDAALTQDRDNRKELERFTGHHGTVNSVAFSPDGRQIASGSNDGDIRIWDVAGGALTRIFTGEVLGPGALRRDRQTAVSGINKLRVWQLADGKVIKTIEGIPGNVKYLAVSPDGERVLIGTDYRDQNGIFPFFLWDLERGTVIRQLKEHPGYGPVAFSPNRQVALTGSFGLDPNRFLILWDLESGRILHRLLGHTDSVTSVAFSPDGRQALSASVDGTVRLWDVESGTQVRVIQAHVDGVNQAIFSHDGRSILSGGGDARMILWDAATGKSLQVFEGHTRKVTGVDLSLDGQRAYSSSSDKTVRIWEVKTGREIARLIGHTEEALSAGLTEDGKTLMSGSFDNTLRFWDVKGPDDMRAWTRENRYVPRLTDAQWNAYGGRLCP